LACQSAEFRLSIKIARSRAATCRRPIVELAEAVGSGEFSEVEAWAAACSERAASDQDKLRPSLPNGDLSSMIRGTRSCARKPIIVEAAERLEASPLASRLIDLPRLKRLIAEWPGDAVATEARIKEYCYGLDRAVHVGQFIRWVEGGNA
jgi:hypothetical protein